MNQDPNSTESGSRLAIVAISMHESRHSFELYKQHTHIVSQLLSLMQFRLAIDIASQQYAFRTTDLTRRSVPTPQSY